MASKFLTAVYKQAGNPTVNSDIDAGYEQGDFWINIDVTNVIWQCLDNSAAAAIWIRMGSAPTADVSDGSTADDNVSTPVVNTWYVPDTTLTVTLAGSGEWELFLRTRIHLDWDYTALGAAAIIIGLGTSITPGTGLFWTHHLASQSMDEVTVENRRVEEVSFNGIAGRFDLSDLDTIYLHVQARGMSGTPAINTFGTRHSSFAGFGTGLLEGRLIAPS